MHCKYHTSLLVHSSEGATALLVSNYSRCSECLSFLYDVWIRLLTWQIPVSHCTNPAGWIHAPLEEVNNVALLNLDCVLHSHVQVGQCVNVYISASNTEKACICCCSVTFSNFLVCVQICKIIFADILDWPDLLVRICFKAFPDELPYSPDISIYFDYVEWTPDVFRQRALIYYIWPNSILINSSFPIAECNNSQIILL